MPAFVIAIGSVENARLPISSSLLAIAVIIGGVLALGMILIRGQFWKNLQNTRTILTDLVSSSGIGDIAGKAAQRKSRMHLLPYGIPLCIVFVSYLIYIHGA